MLRRIEVVACLVACLLAFGCSSSPSRVSQPGYASNSGSAAIDAYDSNSDGAISGDELNAVPALKAAIKQVDTNGDDRITADEIDARVNAWRESRIGDMIALCEVKFNGNLLADAEVVFEPEEFLGSSVPTGKGTTFEDGKAAVKGKGDGMPCGFYKIKVTSSKVDIPAKYNTETTLGCEVANYSHWQSAGEIRLNLSSK